jgi:hypothetical protein
MSHAAGIPAYVPPNGTFGEPTMKNRLWLVLPIASAILLVAQPGSIGAQAKEKVYRSVNARQLEDILNDLSIKFRKSQPENLPEDYRFQFERGGFTVLFTLSKGKVLWLSASFPRVPLEKINQWNEKAKYSRAILSRQKDQEFTIVEWQLDAGGGVTDNMIRQFIKGFHEEVSNFDSFIGKS